MSSPLLQIVDALCDYADQRPQGYASAIRTAERIALADAGHHSVVPDRRAHVRLRPAELDRPMLARLKSGPLLTLIDVSEGGALIETNARLTPGAHVLLEFLAPGTHQITAVPSRIMRSQVAGLDGHVRYRGGCSFKRLLEIAEFMAHRTQSANEGPRRLPDDRLCSAGIAHASTLLQAIEGLRPLLAEPAGSIDCRITGLLDEIATMVHRSHAPGVLMAHIDTWLRRHVPLLALRINACTGERATAAHSLSFALPVPGARNGQSVNVEFRPACALDDSQMRLLEAGAYVMSLLYADHP